MQWVSRITRAFEENRFRLYCQRIAGIRPDGADEEHYEVLVRMVDEGGELVPPMSFIPAAERYSLMHAIDQCVMTLAFSRWQALAASCLRLPMLSINLSGASISDDCILAFIHEQFKRHQVPPRAICFEITETAAIANLTRASKVIRELKELGCRFSLDDFGSGLSSFAYLKNLPVDYLKIDGVFVKDMANDPIDCAMVRAINDIGHVMGIRTIAEWVENEVTLGMLRTIGVDYVQGFAVHVPEPIEAIGGHTRPGARLRLAAG
jgi:EAL domain-containing protein (putative c-di-GMP-specific phosphodiesterase class I)